MLLSNQSRPMKCWIVFVVVWNGFTFLLLLLLILFVFFVYFVSRFFWTIFYFATLFMLKMSGIFLSRVVPLYFINSVTFSGVKKRIKQRYTRETATGNNSISSRIQTAKRRQQKIPIFWGYWKNIRLKQHSWDRDKETTWTTTLGLLK